ncbi:MAG: methyltransferase domain-containing protein [Phycisphaerae bacterium]|jgi:SAM-dependent methyltransferase
MAEYTKATDKQGKKLNLGCGSNIKPGWINLDCKDLPGVDVVHNIEDLPLPFGDNQFDVVRCDNVLEHIEYINLLKDIHRILKPEGLLIVRVPHFTTRLNYSDPTHKKLFSIDTFNFFVAGLTDKDYYFDFHFSRLALRKIRFYKKGIFWLNRLIEPVINCSPKMQRFYESSFLAGLFPANHIYAELIK